MSVVFRPFLQTMDAFLADGIPKGFYPLDVGPQTAAAFRVSKTARSKQGASHARKPLFAVG